MQNCVIFQDGGLSLIVAEWLKVHIKNYNICKMNVNIIAPILGPGEGGGVLPIVAYTGWGSARKGTSFQGPLRRQVPELQGPPCRIKMLNFTLLYFTLLYLSVWKGREICHFGHLKGPKGRTDAFYGCEQVEKTYWFISILKTTFTPFKRDAKF